MVRRISLWLPPLAWASVIFYLSAQSHPLGFLPPEIFTFDKLLHACEYGTLAALLGRALRGEGSGALRAMLLAFALGSAYGASDELHQSFVPGRDADVLDWVADTIGSGLGALALTLLLRRRDTQASIRAS